MHSSQMKETKSALSGLFSVFSVAIPERKKAVAQNIQHNKLSFAV